MKIETRVEVQKLYKQAQVLDKWMLDEKDEQLKVELGKAIIDIAGAIARIVTTDEEVMAEREQMHNLMATKGREGAYKKLAIKNG